MEDDGIEQQFEAIDWNPKDLAIGDRVGLLVTSCGKLCVFQNGEQVVAPTGCVPLDRPLHPFVDLLGNTRAVQLVMEPQAPLVFDMRLKSAMIQLSSDFRRCEHMNPGGDEFQGVMFGALPLPFLPSGAGGDGGFYFEVCVNQVIQGNPDGLVVGVSLALPSPQALPECADEVRSSWSIGYDGQACVKAAFKGAQMTAVDWHPDDLQEGDRVGLFITARGTAWVVLNGEYKERIPARVPVDRPLYPFVDLLGNTAAVTIVATPSPPAGKPPETADCEAAANADDLSPQGEGCAERPRFKTAPGFACFDRQRLSSYVTLSEDCLTARHLEDTNDECQGVVFGDAPLTRFCNNAAYFEVAVTETRVDNPDGLCIGVTMAPFPLEATPPCVADEVLASWSFGYDGQMVVVPEPHCEEVEDQASKPAPKKGLLRFRSKSSVYRVSRFNRSVFGTLKPRASSAEDSDDDNAREVAQG